jgi:hypothetical protein
MDVHIPSEITARLRAKGVDVVSAQEDGTDELPDDMLLDRGTELGRAIFTFDVDFHRITSLRLHAHIPFFCVFFAEGGSRQYKLYAEWLEMYALLGEPEEFGNRLIHLP